MAGINPSSLAKSASSSLRKWLELASCLLKFCEIYLRSPSRGIAKFCPNSIQSSRSESSRITTTSQPELWQQPHPNCDSNNLTELLQQPHRIVTSHPFESCSFHLCEQFFLRPKKPNEPHVQASPLVGSVTGINFYLIIVIRLKMHENISKMFKKSV